jgi:hypothetical protein
MVAARDAEQLNNGQDVGPQRKPGPPPGAGPVYGLGFIGALVWFWRHADDPRSRGLAVAKALVWPAILVHEAFRALDALDR